MAFDNVFHGPPVHVTAPGTKQSPSFGIDIVNNNIYSSSGDGWQELTGTGLNAISQLTGDVTAGPGVGSQIATLATVNSNVGTFTQPIVTVNAKGLVTGISSNLIFKRTVSVSNTGSQTSNTIDSVVIPANSIGANGTIVLEAWFKGQVGNTGTSTPRIIFAGTGGFDISPIAAITSTGFVWTRCFISNQNATNSNQFSTIQNTSLNSGSGTLDFTLAQTINFSLQNTVSADTFFLSQYQITIYP